MVNGKQFGSDERALEIEDEDEKTVAAIDEGIRDAEAGRTAPIEEVRELLRKWGSPKF